MGIKPYDIYTKVKVSVKYFNRKLIVMPRDCCGIILKWSINYNDPLNQGCCIYTVKLNESTMYLDDVGSDEIEVIKESGDTDGDCKIIKPGDKVHIKYKYFLRRNISTPTTLKELDDRRLGQVTNVVASVSNPLEYEVMTLSGKVYKDIQEDELEKVDNFYEGRLTIPRMIINSKEIEDFHNKAIEAMKQYSESPLTKEELREMLNKYTKNETLAKKVNEITYHPHMLPDIPTIDRVIFNDPVTIIFWKNWHYVHVYDKDGNPVMNPDGSPKLTDVQDKTIVKCSPGETYNKYHGFCAAVTKYMFGNNSRVNKIVKNGIDESAKKKEKKSKEEQLTIEDRYECKYYNNKCGRKVTCKQIYNCDGKFDPECKVRKKIENPEKSKKAKGNGKK